LDHLSDCQLVNDLDLLDSRRHVVVPLTEDCATYWKVVSSIPDEVIRLFSIYMILPVGLLSWGQLTLYQK
jgi:hypothetical protein